MSITIQEICAEIPQLDEMGTYASARQKARGEHVPTVADGLEPKRPPAKEGLHLFTPAELLTLHVPVVEVNSSVRGYQRPFERPHARKVARAIADGKPMPPIIVAVDGRGVMSLPEGQHRAVGAVIAREPIEGIVKRMSKEEQRELFAGQRKAKTVDRNVLILAGTGPYERYIQDALVNNRNPWHRIVSANPSSKTRITPYAMLNLLTSFVGNAIGNRLNQTMEERWDQDLADGLAPLVACFGDKQTNPPAFASAALRGIGQAAMYVFRRNEHGQDDDYDRWVVHMPKFPWERYMHVRTTADFTFHLVAHWNKRLHASRRVTL